MVIQSYGDGDGGCWCGIKLVRDDVSGMNRRGELGREWVGGLVNGTKVEEVEVGMGRMVFNLVYF